LGKERLGHSAAGLIRRPRAPGGPEEERGRFTK